MIPLVSFIVVSMMSQWRAFIASLTALALPLNTTPLFQGRVFFAAASHNALQPAASWSFA